MTSLDPGEFHRLVTQATEVLDPTPPPLPDILTRARRRRRRRASAAVTGAVALAGAAAAAVAVLATPGTHDTSNLRPASPVPATTAASSAPVRFGSMIITLPKGWSVVSRYSDPGGTDTQLSPPVTYPAYEDMCIAPDHNHGRQVLNCAGLDFERGAVFGDTRRLFTPHQPDGWYDVIDVLQCPAGEMLLNGNLNAIHGDGAPTSSGFKRVGDKTAVFDQYHAHCDSGFTFTPRSWYLPTSKYRVIDYLGHAETAWILAHIHWSK